MLVMVVTLHAVGLGAGLNGNQVDRLNFVVPLPSATAHDAARLAAVLCHASRTLFGFAARRADLIVIRHATHSLKVHVVMLATHGLEPPRWDTKVLPYR